MKRTQYNNSVKYTDGLARCSPFVINPENANGRLKKSYGKNLKMKSKKKSKLLPERACLTFVTLLKIANGKPGAWIDCQVSDIVKARGVGNPSDEGALMPVRMDLERLLAFQIKINIDADNPKKKGYRACFKLVKGSLDSTDQVSFTISPHLREIEELTGFFFIDTQTYLTALRSPVVRQMYLFLMSQIFIRKEDWKYPISIEKLCNHINYFIADGTPLWQVHQVIQKSANKMVELRLIKSFTLEKKKRGGGVITFYGKRLEKKALPTATNGKPSKPKEIRYKNEIAVIKKQLVKDYDNKDNYDQQKLVNVLRKLKRSKYVGKGKQFSSLEKLVKYYCTWLVDESKLKYYSTVLFDPGNGFLKEFIKTKKENDDINDQEHRAWTDKFGRQKSSEYDDGY